MELLGLLNRQKNKSLNVAIIFLALFISFKLYQKQQKDLAVLNQTKETEIKKNGVIANIAQLEKKISLYKTNFAKKDADSVMSELGSLAAQCKVKLLSIRPGPEQKAADYTKYTYSLSAGAQGYHALGKFISLIEGAKDVYIVENLHINPANKDDELMIGLTVSQIVFGN